jgi:hypothetical protein
VASCAWSMRRSCFWFAPGAAPRVSAIPTPRPVTEPPERAGAGKSRGRCGSGTLKASCLGQRPATKRADAAGARLSCVFPSGWASLSAWPRIDVRGLFFLTFADCCRNIARHGRGFALPPQTGLTLCGYLSFAPFGTGIPGRMANFAPTDLCRPGLSFLPVCGRCRLGYRDAVPAPAPVVGTHEQPRPGIVRAFFHLKNSSALRVPSRRYTRSAHE